MKTIFNLSSCPSLEDLAALERHFLYRYYFKLTLHISLCLGGFLFSFYAQSHLDASVLGYGLLLSFLAFLGLLFFLYTHSLRDNPARPLSSKEEAFICKHSAHESECLTYIQYIRHLSRPMCYFDFCLLLDRLKANIHINSKRAIPSI